MIEHLGTVLYGKQENKRCKMASTTKIMTSVIVVENVKDINEKTIISPKAAAIGGSRLGLHTNDEVSIKDLLYSLLMCSGNDAAIALAEYVAGTVPEFANLMNKKAEELNLKDTHFVTPHGLDEDEHYTTAYELALITDYALNKEVIQQIVKTKSYTVTINGNPKNINNTNELLGYLQGVYGVKTGFTNGANRCLVTSIKRGDMNVICVVLGADTKKDRGADSIKLIEYIFSNFQMVDIEYMIQDNFGSLCDITKFNISKGINNNLQIDLEENNITLYPVYKDNIKDIRVETEVKKELNAPVHKEDVIGKLTVRIDDNVIYELKILAKNDIRKKKVFDYYKNFVTNMSNWWGKGIDNRIEEYI